MKILIAPLAALAETKGPISRARALAQTGLLRGHKVAFCTALDFNYQPVEGVPNYFAPIPSPFGTPLAIGRRVFKIAQKSGLQARRIVRSFEEVLHIIGAIHPTFFPRDVKAIRYAVRQFQPDVVFSEFRPAAIVAARLEGLPVVTGLSVPAHWRYASSPKFSGGVRSFLVEHHLPPVQSVLEIFDWAELKFIASSYKLEPMEGEDIHHVGPYFGLRPPSAAPMDRNSLIAYMGNGTISPNLLQRVITQAFRSWNGSVYIASQQIPPRDVGNLHFDREFNFSQLMPTARVFINHGGQNSVMTGLVHGTPQVVCSGKVFERQYNAWSVQNLKAGLMLAPEQFNPTELRDAVSRLESDPIYAQNALTAGSELLALGGATSIYTALEERFHK